MPAAPRPRWVVWAAVGALACLTGFSVLTLAIYGHGPLLSVDLAVEHTFSSHRQHWLVRAFSAETQTASFFVAGPLLLATSAVLARVQRSWRPLLLGLAAVVLLAASVGTGKEVIGRSRVPFAANAFGDGGTSYPSGHTTTAVVVTGCLVLLLDPWLSRASRRACLAGVVTYAVVTGFSRIYLRDHWFTDVLGGWFLGSAIVCLLAVAWSAVALQRRQATQT